MFLKTHIFCSDGLSCETIGSQNEITVCIGTISNEAETSDLLTFGLIGVSALFLLCFFCCCLRIHEAYYDETEEDEDYLDPEEAQDYEKMYFKGLPSLKKKSDEPKFSKGSKLKTANKKFKSATTSQIPTQITPINVGT